MARPRPAYYRLWASGATEQRRQLKRVDGITFLKRPVLAVFDPSNLRLLAYIAPN